MFLLKRFGFKFYHDFEETIFVERCRKSVWTVINQ